jgi:hypothetical protein
MSEVPSTRRLWTMYKQVLMEDGFFGRRDLILAQGAFYAGVRATWKVLGHLAEDEEPEALLRLIEKR